MLIVALIEQQEITGLCGADFFSDEARVFLNQFQRADVGALFAVGQPPVVAQRALRFGKHEIRRRDTANAVRLEPLGVVIAQGFGYRESHQSGAITMSPARRGAGGELRIDDAHEPRAKGASLFYSKDCGGRHWLGRGQVPSVKRKRARRKAGEGHCKRRAQHAPALRQLGCVTHR